MTAARRSMLLMVAFVALWAALEALSTRLSIAYSAYQVVWMRYAVHLAFMALVWGWRDPASLWRTQRPLFQWSRSVLMLAMPASWIIASEAGVEAGALASVFWLSPLLVLAFARLFLGERPTAGLWLLCALACVGALLLSPHGAWPSPALLVFPAGMALSFSLYVVMTRSLRSETTRTNLFYTALGVFVLLSPLMPGVWMAPPLHDVAVMTGVGLLGWLGLWALDRLAAAAPVSVAAPLACLQLPFALALAGAWHGLRVPSAALAGLVLIAGVACFLLARPPRLTVLEPV